MVLIYVGCILYYYVIEISQLRRSKMIIAGSLERIACAFFIYSFLRFL